MRREFTAGLLFGLRVVWPIVSVLLGAIVVLGLLVGFIEGWSVQESIYFAFVSGLTIGYGDLDLSYPGDRRILRQRIALTARFLCDKLGESDTGPGTCRDVATRDALRRVGTIEEHFAPRGTAWVRPAPWTPPYPVVWVQQYP